MPDAKDINVFEDIQSLCKDFRRCLKRAHERRIEDYLDRVGDSSREMLFQNLLHIDMAFRRRRNEEPASDDYLQRFPRFSRLIRQAFFESTLMSMEVDAETPAEVETVVIGLPAARRLGEYELLRELGRGGFGVVYAARHLQRGETVALKTLPTGLGNASYAFDDAERLHKFRQEFRALSEVNHPHLIGMQTLEVDSGQWFFTMDLVDGVDFLDYVRPQGHLDEQRLRATLKQLIQGIIALHERGIVHRDLKPNNVLVNTDGHVVILDFGLVAELRQQTDQTVSMQSRQFAGTPRYAAPEQAVGTRTTATDWYALGVMMYEALIGKAPFQGSAVQVIVKKQTEDAPTLSGNAELARDLAKLADQLLQRDPEQRPRAAEICRAVGIATEPTSQDASGNSSATTSSHSEMLLVGRESQLAELEKARQESRKGEIPVVVFISGRSGEGKTSLVEKFLVPLRRDREQLVLSGRCYDRESVPFKAIDGLVDALVAQLRSRGTDEVLRLLPDDIHMLAHLFPVLRRVKAIADRATVGILGIEERQVRNRALHALRELLIEIGRETPVTLFIDDLQWGDGDSAKVLFELLSPPAAPNVLLLGSFRTDEATKSPFLQEWQKLAEQAAHELQRRDVHVEPLTEQQCLDLLAARVAVQPAELRQQATELFEDTRGNPYFLEQLIEGFDAETGRFEAVPLGEIIDRKLKRLPTDSSSLLEVISIAGQSVSLEEVSQVAGCEQPAFATITHMRSERLVRLVGSQDAQLVDTYHDKIRETLLGRMDLARRQELHRTYAAWLEAQAPQLAGARLEASDAIDERVFDLAHHAYEASHPRAFAYQLLAGKAALAAYAMENGLKYLEQAEQIQPDVVDHASRFQLHFMLAKARAGCHMLSQAIDDYSRALQLTDVRQNRAACYFALGEIHWIRSDYDKGMDCLRMGFAELGERLPKTIIGKLLGTVASFSAFHCLPTWASRRFRKHSDAELSILSKMYSLIHWLVIQFDMPLALLVSVRGCVVAKHHNAARAKAEAYASYASILSLAGAAWVAKLVNARAKKYAAALSEDEVTGKIDCDIGLQLYCAGRLQESEESLNQAADRLGRSGHYQQSYPRHFLWHLWSLRGDAQQVIRHAGEEEAIARRSNDQVVLAYAWYGQAEGLARQGNTSEGLRLAEQAVTTLESVQGTFLCVANLQKARVQLQAGSYDDARGTLGRVLKDIPKLRFNDLTVPAFPLLVEAILADKWCEHPDSITRQDLRKASWAAWAGRLSGLLFPNNRPAAFRTTGRIATARGKTKRALAYFDKAIAAAEKIGADYEHARSLIDKSLLDHSNAPADRARGLAILAERGCVLPDAERKYLSTHYDTQRSVREGRGV